MSIHLNSYPSESCKGAQTFYANDENSKLLAEKIQKNMVNILDESNTRIAKKLTSVYLLKNVNIPSVIVECGFLSNSEEEKLLLDENGKVINEYIDADGNKHYGAYDYVPILDQFIEEHPDASYRGAKATVALTGYNGVLGYRTDETYSFDNLENPDIDKNKRDWLKAHPEFTLEAERAAAKEVADAMKANGWTFASHTWGHLRVGDKPLENLKRDNEKWKKNIVPIVGETNVIIFAHGQDLGNWGKYDMTNEKVKYFMSEGYDVFCNVDSNEYRTYFGDTYLRQGRRNLDGIRFWYNLTGQQNNLSDLFDVKEVYDTRRPDYTAFP